MTRKVAIAISGALGTPNQKESPEGALFSQVTAFRDIVVMLNMVDRKTPKNQSTGQISLNLQQKLAVDHSGGPLLVTAGAGSGKTRTLTQRLIKLIETGTPPEKILAITFTNKAADEIRSRIMKHFGYRRTKTLPTFIGTFHSLGARILRAQAETVGRDNNFVIFDSDDSLQLIKKIIKSGSSEESWTKQPAKVQREISTIKDTLIEVEDIENEALKKLFGRYEDALKRSNAFDFDDLIEKTARLLRDHPEIKEKYGRRWEHVLVDECQDINLAQYELLKRLVGEHGNLFVIGDDHQAIYGFRNADFKYLLSFERDWPGAKVLNLGENYRSTGNIVRASAAVIENNKFQRSKKLWTNNLEGSLIKVMGAMDPEDEAERIVNDILNYRPVISNTAVLYRTNAQSRALEQALNSYSLPYEIYGGVKFYERKEIKDILAALRYGSNPKDEVSLERLNKNFLKKISKTLIENLPGAAKELSVLELIGFFLKTANYLEFLGAKFQNSEERIENIQELIAFAGEFKSLPEFLERVTLLQATDTIKNKDVKIAPVKLMTIHLAKGLEFDSVYVAGAVEGVLPHQRSLKTLEDLEEERRLMYVAMTRAKKHLALSFYDLASRFLYEIPPELIDFTGFGSWKEGDEVYLI